MDPDRLTELPKDMVARVIAAAYGDAGLWDRWRVSRAARRNPVVRDLLEAHRRVASEVRQTPSPRVPARVVDSAWDEIVRLDPRVARSPVLSMRVLYASGAAFAAALCLLAVLHVSHRSSAQPEAYTQAEIEEARHQLEVAFALVNRSVEKAGIALNDEVLLPNVVRPIRGGTAIVEKLFRKENTS